jgi:hypothetical protein
VDCFFFYLCAFSVRIQTLLYMHAEVHHPQIVHSNEHQSTRIKWSFFVNGIKNFFLTILRELRLLNILAYVTYFLTTFFTEFAMGYKTVQVVVSVISGPIIIYLFGTYLTLLPNYIVILLMFFPKKMVMPLLILTMVFNFFGTFLI